MGTKRKLKEKDETERETEVGREDETRRRRNNYAIAKQPIIKIGPP